jgi:tRNA G18 (ribose-2'-O)-methylase SpoU
MSRETITSLDDPRIAVYRSLKLTNQTRGLDHFVVEGAKLLERLLASRFPVVSVLATDRSVALVEPMLPANVPLFVVPFEQIHAIVGFAFHRGVLACGQRIPWPKWEETIGPCGRCLTLVVCPKLSNPENLGSIARIGDVFGVDAMLAGPSCPDPLSRRVLRVSMGSVLRLPIHVSHRLEETAERLMGDHGVEFWAAVASPSAQPFESVERPLRLALVLGDEDRGVETDWLSRCTRQVTIPMRGQASSLNVSVAAGILLYQLSKPPPGR